MFSVKASTLLAQAPNVFLSDEEKNKEALSETCQTFEVSTAWTSGLVNLDFSHQNGFF